MNLKVMGSALVIITIALHMTGMPVGGRDTGYEPADGFSGFTRLLEFGAGKGVRAVAWSPDASKVAIGDDSGIVSVYDSGSGSLVKRINAHTNAVSAISWSRQGKVATGSYDNTVKIWDSATWEEKATIKNHTDRVWDVAWSSDGNELATAGRDGKVYTFTPAGEYLAEMEVSVTGLARAVAWEPAGDFLAGIVEDDFTKKPIMYKWSASSGRVKKELTINVTAFDLAWDSNGARLGAALQNGSIVVIDADMFLPERFIPVSNGALYTLFWGKGESKNLIVTAGEDKRIYSVTSEGNTTFIPEVHSDLITHLSLSPNGTMFASAGMDKRAIIWGDTHPRVVWHLPEDNAKNVSLHTNITIKFDRKMNETSLRASISLSGAQFNLVVKENNTIAVILPGGLAPETTYTVTIKMGAKDLAGGTMPSDFTFRFTTEQNPAAPFIEIPWLWIGVILAVIILILIIVVIVSRRRRRGGAVSSKGDSEVDR
jgi:WD40 repeat protein